MASDNEYDEDYYDSDEDMYDGTQEDEESKHPTADIVIAIELIASQSPRTTWTS
jgi:hypothetical protein